MSTTHTSSRLNSSPEHRITAICQDLIGDIPVVHLSFFDGIGAASAALLAVGARVALTLAWETDPGCRLLTTELYQVVHMGDVWNFDVDEVYQKVVQSVQVQNFLILITGGPPCPDFSQIRENPPGVFGETGGLFETLVEIEHDIREHFRGYPVETIIENVVPHEQVRHHVSTLSERLAMSPVIIDAADGGVMHRKRLWWTSCRWDDISNELSTATPWTLHWHEDDVYPRLHNPMAAELQPGLHSKEYSLPRCIQAGKLFHCLTTPAPTEAGRPPPKRTRHSREAMARWEQDNKRFPPWQYESDFLVQYPDETLSVAPAELRERLMGYSGKYTEPIQELLEPTEYHRNRALANTWHLPTAVWIIFLVLLGVACAEPVPPPAVTTVQRVVSLWRATAVPFGPPPRRDDPHYMPQFSWTEHLEWAKTLDQSFRPKDIDPTLVWCIQHRHLFHPLPVFQARVIEEIEDMVLDFEEQTTDWYNLLLPHARRAYTHTSSRTQIPVLLSLLQQLEYPQLSVLSRELTLGFDLMGTITPGVNWHVRRDQKYLEPTSLPEFAEKNRTYIHQKLRAGNVDQHWERMADEIAEEVRAGRMNGPFKAPSWWNVETVQLRSAPDLALSELPDDEPYIAVAFSIEQIGSDGNNKVRRGEDWRRSGHNSTCIMHDQPFHHTPDHFIALGFEWLRGDPACDLQVWGHDHDGAYRQLPLRHPRQAYVLLMTPDGPTLWNHNVLLFGSAASVWSYNRFGDMLVTCSRILILCPALHYVDDYGSMEPVDSADSSFQAFEDLNSVLGFFMKKAKRQPPAGAQRIQGVLISSDSESLALTPCPKRVQQVTRLIDDYLHSGTLTPELARKLAGKCNFLTGRLFGRVGRAPLKAVYARANSSNTKLDKPTLAALLSLKNIINHCRPMIIPRDLRPAAFSVIYTDAYFKLGKTVYRPGDEVIPEWDPNQTPGIENGWAAVCFYHGDSSRATYFQGRLPSELLRQFSANQAFIYLLEAWVAILAPMIFRPLLDDYYVQCCDNEASRHALLRGVGKHQPLNCLVAAHWTWHNRQGLSHRLERVPTKANISDPFSRFEDTEEYHEWVQLSVDWNPWTHRALRVIGDLEFACTSGFSDIPGLRAVHEHLALVFAIDGKPPTNDGKGRLP